MKETIPDPYISTDYLPGSGGPLLENGSSVLVVVVRHLMDPDKDGTPELPTLPSHGLLHTSTVRNLDLVPHIPGWDVEWKISMRSGVV